MSTITEAINTGNAIIHVIIIGVSVGIGAYLAIDALMLRIFGPMYIIELQDNNSQFRFLRFLCVSGLVFLIIGVVEAVLKIVG